MGSVQPEMLAAVLTDSSERLIRRMLNLVSGPGHHGLASSRHLTIAKEIGTK
jgi:hypothetical protein